MESYFILECPGCGKVQFSCSDSQMCILDKKYLRSVGMGIGGGSFPLMGKKISDDENPIPGVL